MAYTTPMIKTERFYDYLNGLPENPGWYYFIYLVMLIIRHEQGGYWNPQNFWEYPYRPEEYQGGSPRTPKYIMIQPRGIDADCRDKRM